MSKRTMLLVTMVAALALMLGGPAPSAWAQIGQAAPLPGSAIPQWVNQLPTLFTAGGTMEDVVLPGPITTNLYMREFKANILPPLTPTLLPYTGTHVFGYRKFDTSATQDTYIGPVFVPARTQPTEVNYINNLGQTSTSNVIFWKTSIDQTLHWANPDGGSMMDMTNYTGPIPAVPHLHGGEVPAAIDGGPDAWFLSNAYNATDFPTYSQHGQGYYSFAGGDDGNASIYRYPNTQEAGPLWFHDHLLGGTRLNVYAGLAGAYLLIDTALNLPPGMNAVGLNNGTLDLSGTPLGAKGPNTELTVPLVLQDRMFTSDTGELYFPNLGLNPEHPFWIPEFVGDTVVVNGKAWPNLNVEAKRYRFLMINGSNARFYELSLGKNVPMYVIGTDGGYLDNAVMVNKLVIGPGERYQLIIDFGKYAGKTLLMGNTGRTPFPKGTPPQGSTLGRIVQFTVGTAPAGGDLSYNPALTPAIRTGTQMIQRLVTPPGTLNTLLPPIAQNRQLTLNEVIGPGGPLEILVNNTKWNGLSSDTATYPGGVRPNFVPDGIGNYLSELPAESTTEVWEIINITADAHPIHLHLVQFQILNRQNFNVNKYMKAYNAAFPAGVFTPAFGPPQAYTLPGTTSPITNAPIVGGNPDVTTFLQGMPSPADPNEAGWKDTAIMYPGQVTRIAVRFSPTDITPGATAYYPFIPNPPNPYVSGATYDFVWHCHIVDHEDNEMMRPYQVDPIGSPTNPGIPVRTYFQGTNY